MSIHTSSRTRRHLVLLSALLIALFAAQALAPAQQCSSSPLRALPFSIAQDEPVAEAGPNQTVHLGDVVVLDGSWSFGFEGADKLNYTWTVTFESRTKAILYDQISQITFNSTGIATVNLTVEDSKNRTSWDTTYITVILAPPTFLEKNAITIIIVAIAVVLYLRFGLTATRRKLSGQPAMTDADKEKVHLGVKRWSKILKALIRNPMGFTGVCILVFFVGMAIIGPEIAGQVKGVIPGNALKPPSPEHWLGTDNTGLDIFHQLLYGARTSIVVGIVSAVIASFLGAAVGLYSGYVGGVKDEVVMRLNDIVLSIPWLVLMIVVAALLGRIDLTGIILIIGLTGWSYTARMVRAQVLSVKERQYIERARAIGASDLDIIRRHVFPNTFPLIFANTILTVAVSILSEATLSFLGLRPVGEVTWGTMLSFASEASAFQIGLHWWILAPGLCIVSVVLGFTLLGYALDEILNPKLRRR